MSLDHEPPKPFPAFHYVGLAVPSDLAKVIAAKAKKDGVLFSDMLLAWTQMGAECSRTHQPDKTRTGRKR